MAYNMLLTRIPAPTMTPSAHAALRREDYPNVRFWTRQDWNSAIQEDILEVNQPEESETFPELEEEGDDSKESSAPPPGPGCRGKHRSSQGINVTMKYIELEDGTVVDGFRAAEIRRYARSLWVQMAIDEKLPKTWSDADAHSLTTYSMYGAAFPGAPSLFRRLEGKLGRHRQLPVMAPQLAEKKCQG